MPIQGGLQSRGRDEASILGAEGSSEPEGGGRDRGGPPSWLSEGARPPPSAAPQNPLAPALLRPEGSPHLPACRFHQAALFTATFLPLSLHNFRSPGGSGFNWCNIPVNNAA